MSFLLFLLGSPDLDLLLNLSGRAALNMLPPGIRESAMSNGGKDGCIHVQEPGEAEIALTVKDEGAAAVNATTTERSANTISAGRLLHFFRSQTAIRTSTIFVILLSDSTLAGSCIFMVKLINIGGFGYLWPILMSMFLLAYFVGVLYFGPRQKYQAVEIFQKMVLSNPRRFVNSKVMEKIMALKAVRDDYEEMPSLMAEYWETTREDYEEIIHMWIRAQQTNAVNLCDATHGVPFLRLARFGFVAQPKREDLSGLLNANALFGLSVGIWQFVFGSIVLRTAGTTAFDTSIVFTCLVSLFSLVLSLMGTLFDFNGLLLETAMEELILKELETQRDGLHEDRKEINHTIRALDLRECCTSCVDFVIDRRMEIEYERKVVGKYDLDTGAKYDERASITRMIEGTGVGQLLSNIRRTKLGQMLGSVNDKEQAEHSEENFELHLYQARRWTTKKNLRGEITDSRAAQLGQEIVDDEHIAAIEHERAKVYGKATKEMAAVSPAGMTPRAYEEKLDQITTGHSDHLRNLNQQQIDPFHGKKKTKSQ